MNFANWKRQFLEILVTRYHNAQDTKIYQFGYVADFANQARKYTEETLEYAHIERTLYKKYRGVTANQFKRIREGRRRICEKDKRTVANEAVKHILQLDCREKNKLHFKELKRDLLRECLLWARHEMTDWPYKNLAAFEGVDFSLAVCHLKDSEVAWLDKKVVETATRMMELDVLEVVQDYFDRHSLTGEEKFQKKPTIYMDKTFDIARDVEGRFPDRSTEDKVD